MSKYPIYFGAGNFLVPYDPDKPMSKWQVIALAFLAVGTIIIIIVVLASSNGVSNRDYYCWESTTECPVDKSKIQATKTYTKGKENKDCCSNSNGRCNTTLKDRDGINNTAQKTCRDNKNEYDCNLLSSICKWKSGTCIKNLRGAGTLWYGDNDDETWTHLCTSPGVQGGDRSKFQCSTESPCGRQNMSHKYMVDDTKCCIWKPNN